jgi:hypothetical protein
VLPRSRPDLIGKGRRIEAVIGLAVETKGDAMAESAAKWAFKGKKYEGLAFIGALRAACARLATAR